MTYQSQSSEQTINIKMLAHVDGQLFMAVSDDLPGLSVVGLSPEEIESKIEPAIRDFLEMSGYEVTPKLHWPDESEMQQVSGKSSIDGDLSRRGDANLNLGVDGWSTRHSGPDRRASM